MAEFKILKPAGEANVRRPDNLKHLKRDGEMVEINSYWTRRLAAGEVVEVVIAKMKTTGGKE